MRRSLYVMDDDYRQSMLHGSFVTLTNLTEEDWQRIEEQRLGPMHVSVHATNPELRALLVGNPAFGGTVTSRLAAELRQMRGWSNAVSARAGGPGPSVWAGARAWGAAAARRAPSSGA